MPHPLLERSGQVRLIEIALLIQGVEDGHACEASGETVKEKDEGVSELKKKG